MVPPDKLLIMDVKDGWEPLCKFLEVPVPDEPMPRANDAARAEETAQQIFGKLISIWAGIGVGVVAISGVLVATTLRLRRH